jgi:hypothetical protein
MLHTLQEQQGSIMGKEDATRGKHWMPVASRYTDLAVPAHHTGL